ncbi:immunoglobulin-like and fibronectin type III domain-containing protein 1 [Osmerus mordax]|uniref:immunoglobulin-like and fibronectin type III domain-containing protein 1 n=1 Tax=Osmerus mordax TaxID=8014 RepID=UPI00350F8F0A
MDDLGLWMVWGYADSFIGSLTKDVSVMKNPAASQAPPGQAPPGQAPPGQAPPGPQVRAEDDTTPPGGVLIKRRSRVPGVMISQYVEEVPAGMSTPDFTRKPIALTIQEGKLAFFKAMVKGQPAPTVTWTRNKGELTDTEKYTCRYDDKNKEYFLEMPNVTAEQADTYKCFATNEYGQAVSTASLNIIEVGYKKNKQKEAQNESEDFRKMLKKKVVRAKPLPPKKEGEIDPKFWEVLLSSAKKDYEKVCAEFGITDFRWMLKTLNMMKKEREEEQAKLVKELDNMKQIEVKPNGRAEFELDMELKDPNSKVYLFKDGVMLDYNNDDKSKHKLEQVGKKYLFSIKDLSPEDAGLYQVDVENTNMFSTDFKIVAAEFAGKIQDVTAKEGEDAVYECTLSQPCPQIVWFGNSVTLEKGDKYDITVSEDQLVHTLKVRNCKPEDKGVYMALAGITSCSASLTVQAGDGTGRKTAGGGGGADLSKISQKQESKLQKEKGERDGKGGGDGGEGKFVSGLSDTAATLGDTAELSCKLSSEDCQGVWYKDGKPLTSGDGVTIIKDGACHRLVIQKCSLDDGAVYRFEADGRKSEASLTVQNPPVFDLDALSKFSEPVIIRAGETAEWKLTFSGGEPMKIQWLKDDEELMNGLNVKLDSSPTHTGLRLTKCQRKDSGVVKLKIKNEFGSMEATSKLIVLDKPTPPQGPVDILESAITSVEFKWKPPKDNGGCPVTNYLLERQQVGRNKWTALGAIPGDPPSYRDGEVDPGRRYCYHIRAKNAEGISDFLETEDIQAGVLCYPGSPSAPKVVSAFKDCINLAWSPPSNTGGTKILGYNLEKRKKGSNMWSPVNIGETIKETHYAVKDVQEGAAYEFRVTAINLSGPGEPSPPSETVFARDPKMRPRFTDDKMKSFMVVKAGNTVRVNINFEACPLPDIVWLKDGVPVSKRVTVTNSDRGSQLLIPTSERVDTGIYTIIVKNLVGQETFNVEIRVTDDPKPPGPVELEQNVPGTVTVSWTPSPDEKRDDRLHYVVSKRDSIKRTWRTVADHLFNNKCTIINILPGREYHFRVFARNDMSLSEPTESPTWRTENRRGLPLHGERAIALNFQTPPSFLVPLKRRTSPQGYECYMSCAVRGDPTPHVTWYRNNISLNTNTNYYISNTCGVCSMLILRVGPKDTGEYTVVADNPLGRAECSTKLIVKE